MLKRQRFTCFLNRSARTLGIGALALTLSLSGAPAVATEAEPSPAVQSAGGQDTPGRSEIITPSMLEAEGEVTAYIELSGQSALDASGANGGPGQLPFSTQQGQAEPNAASINTVKSVQGQVSTSAESLADEADARVLYTTHNLQRGVALTGNAQAIRSLAERNDVVRISRIVPKHPTNASSVQATGALDTWRNTGATGKGVTIAVIDTGIDYTHADFGGPGTDSAYTQARLSSDMPRNTYDSQKVVGGYDLVGDYYNGTNSPQPDNNPLDCSYGGGHGTHVAGTAAGYGVGGDGKTFTGDYAQLSAEQVRGMNIGPGAAPQARLTALRVFGCTGSTSMTGQALDRVLDPNNDGNFSDSANIVNLSLGTDYAAADDPENAMLERLMDRGVLAVVAAGNAQANRNQGDVYSILGSPANTPAALTVANSETTYRREGESTVPERDRGILAASSSRGLHGSNGFVKPDVAAPGTNISSAGVGSGNRSRIMSGTSMATPYVAGIAAQIMGKEPLLDQQQVKARIMNTANGEVRSGNSRLGVDRVGAGRVNSEAATNRTATAYNAQHPEQVSLSFGVLEVPPNAGVKTYTREVKVRNDSNSERTFRLGFDARATTAGVEVKTPDSVTVGARAEATFTVTLTADPARLAKTHDSGTAVEQEGFARQYLSSVSGNVTLDDGQESLLVPLHAAPKPVSTMSVPDNALDFGSGTEVRFKPEGTGLNQDGYKSTVAPFELGYTDDSPACGTSSERAMSIRYAGASSNVPGRNAVASAGPRMIAFGIATKGDWGALTPAYGVEVEIDTNRDGTADYKVVVGRKPRVDYPMAVVYSRSSNYRWDIDAQPLNGVDGSIDSNTFDTNVAMLPVKLSALGMPSSGGSAIKYRVSTSVLGNDREVSKTDWVEFNPYSPALQFDAGRHSEPALSYWDGPDTIMTVQRAAGTTPKALFLHLHNPSESGAREITGGTKVSRTQVVQVRGSGADPAPAQRFRDVPPSHPFFREIGWLAQKGITTGYPDGTYRPDNNIERGAVAAYFYRLAGSPAFEAPAVSPFKDVGTDHQFYKEITWLASQGITTGYPDGTFHPQESISREAMAAFFYRYNGSQPVDWPQQPQFRDVDTDHPFYKEITWLANRGITTGWPDGTFRPGEPIRRDAMAAFVYRNSKR